jgi:hypothetical protein
MEHRVLEFKVKSASWKGRNLLGNHAVEFFDLTGFVHWFYDLEKWEKEG